MNIKKSNDSNNGIVTTLKNVRLHSNANKLQLATVLGNTVIVGLDSKEDDIIVYFDSNLKLSPEFLSNNNLYYDSTLNNNKEVKGYFGSSGRVKATKLRGEISNGLVCYFDSLSYIGDIQLELGTEFQEIDGHKICEKYVPQNQHSKNGSGQGRKNKKEDNTIQSDMFVRHWDTKHFFREIDQIPLNSLCICEEKIHGSSGRIGNVRVKRDLNIIERILKKLGVKIQEYEWKTVHGSRNITLSKKTELYKKHAESTREIIFNKVKDHIRKGEQIYFEISGFETNGSYIQKDFPYGCKVGEHRVILYRVTQNNEDGEVVDMSREYVYKRAEELGLEKPHVFDKFINVDEKDLENTVISYTTGKSALDPNTMREGVVVWFENKYGRWSCLKNKSEEFLLRESKNRDKGIIDQEDVS